MSVDYVLLPDRDQPMPTVKKAQVKKTPLRIFSCTVMKNVENVENVINVERQALKTSKRRNATHPNEERLKRH